jgi:hypothetical protein
MYNQQLRVGNNLQHKVFTLVEAPAGGDTATSVVALAEHYFRTQVAGQAAGTRDAKQ